MARLARNLSAQSSVAGGEKYKMSNLVLTKIEQEKSFVALLVFVF